MGCTAFVLLALLGVLLVYLFATRDTEYVPISQRVKEWVSKRQSINYYGFRGPFFVEDFTNFHGENNPKEQLVPTCGECEIPKYNKNVPGMLKCNNDSLEACQIPTLTAEQSWRNEYHNSVYRLGGPDAYRQVTNNNLSAPNNLKSAQMKSFMGDYFDPVDKVSPWCYTESMKAQNCNTL